VKEASFNRAPADFWVQLRFDDSNRVRRGRSIAALGLLKRGVTVREAQAEMTTIAAALESQYQEFNRDWTVNLIPLREQFTGEIRPVLYVLFGAVLLTLFIACANVANLQLVRATARSREFTVRAALGASRGRLVRFLLTESALLSMMGGLLGLGVGAWGLKGLQRLSPDGLLPTAPIPLNLGVLAFTMVVAAATGLLFGLVPALLASNPHLTEALKEGSRGGTSGRGRRVRQVFVTAQVALAVVVLIGAGLLARSFDRLVSTNAGFDAGNLLTARVAVPSSVYNDPTKVRTFYEQLLARLRAIPGVTLASGNVFAPFSGPGAATSFEVVGQPVAVGQKPVADVRIVLAGYFETMKVPVLQGRAFTPEEFAEKRDAVVINETLARIHFPGRNPIGEKLVINMRNPNTPSTIVGVVGDIRHQTLATPPREMTYWPHIELPLTQVVFVIRTAQSPQQILPSLQREVWALDRNLPVSEPRLMVDLMASTTARSRFATLLFGLFATLALVLSALGIYAVISYKVALETRDIGVKMALGADRSLVMRQVLGAGARLAAVGVVVGVALAFGLTRLLTSQLYEITTTDPVTFVGVPAFLLALSAIACLPAARRASGVEPVVALRQE
jgi:putative ABC transport system permease protein